MTDQTTPAGFDRGEPDSIGEVTMFTPAGAYDQHVADTLRAKAAAMNAHLTATN